MVFYMVWLCKLQPNTRDRTAQAQHCHLGPLILAQLEAYQTHSNRSSGPWFHLHAGENHQEMSHWEKDFGEHSQWHCLPSTSRKRNISSRLGQTQHKAPCPFSLLKDWPSPAHSHKAPHSHPGSSQGWERSWINSRMIWGPIDSWLKAKIKSRIHPVL